MLPTNFYNCSVEELARKLIGCELISLKNDVKTSGIIVEVEAYHENDPASHTYNGQTNRTKAMFGPPGHAYVYLSYGIHWCFNVTAESEGVGAGVLIRALDPQSGIDVMKDRRNQSSIKSLTNGPGKLTQALAITNDDYGHSLRSPPLYVSPPPTTISADQVTSGSRIGISKAVDHPWRFCLKGNQFVSR